MLCGEGFHSGRTPRARLSWVMELASYQESPPPLRWPDVLLRFLLKVLQLRGVLLGLGSTMS